VSSFGQFVSTTKSLAIDKATGISVFPVGGIIYTNGAGASRTNVFENNFLTVADIADGDTAVSNAFLAADVVLQDQIDVTVQEVTANSITNTPINGLVDISSSFGSAAFSDSDDFAEVIDEEYLVTLPATISRTLDADNELFTYPLEQVYTAGGVVGGVNVGTWTATFHWELNANNERVTYEVPSGTQVIDAWIYLEPGKQDANKSAIVKCQWFRINPDDGVQQGGIVYEEQVFLGTTNEFVNIHLEALDQTRVDYIGQQFSIVTETPTNGDTITEFAILEVTGLMTNEAAVALATFLLDAGATTNAP
jgi:hypothetical protein